MKRALPVKTKDAETIALPLRAKRKFPSIPRIIPENIGLPRLHFYTIVVGVVSLGISFFIGIETLRLHSNIQMVKQELSQKATVMKELQYWEDVSLKHAGYRDAYLQIAVRAYILGDRVKAKENIQKSLALDPNFEAGIAFAKKIGE
ncbi:MAG: hypothetical protein HY430_03860 [Candidatus Levybacteria bacterium]|nr:hypothetical protein [Candidatus Levybacteria bacterium]